MDPELLSIILQHVGVILGATATIVTALVGIFLKKKVKNDDLREGLMDLNESIWISVREMEQTLGTELKAAKEDGEISDEEKKAIGNKMKSQAKDKALSLAKDDGLKLLKKVLGDERLKEYINSRIESDVLKLRGN